MTIKSREKNPNKGSMDSLSSQRSFSSFPRFDRRKLIPLLLFAGAIFLFAIPSDSRMGLSNRMVLSHEVHQIEIVNVFPHDPKAFTQGLLYTGNDTLYESTGLYGESSVRKVDLRTGKVQAIHHMDASYFGEGLTLLGERLFQLTWLKKTGFLYDLNDLSKVKRFEHQMQDGWGLATDGKALFGSDGSSTLYQIDPQTFNVTQKHDVRYNGRKVNSINELEYIKGEVWANVWQTDCIARISPKDGSLLGWILLPALREHLISSGHHDIDVLNGIAWDEEKQRLFVTGKLWPKLYEIKLNPVKKQLGKYIEQHCVPI